MGGSKRRAAIVAAGLIVVAALGTTFQSRATAIAANGPIAYVNARSGTLDVWTMLPDGSNDLQLTTDPSNDLDPAPSSDGNRYVFVSTRDGNREVYVMNADGSGQKRLTSTADAEQDAVFSTDDSRIIFSRATGSFDAHIFSMAADGTDEIQLTFEFGDDHSPAISPDGTRIAFVRESNIHVMDADGTGTHQITDGGGFDPAFMPDGRIAFRKTNDIYVMNADGSSEINLTNAPTFEADPSPSPDGRFIAFTTFRDGQFDIDRMRVDGSERTTLTQATTDDVSPAWGAIDPPPVTTITDQPSALTNDATPTFGFVADEEATFECSVAPAGSTSYEACDSPMTIDPALADGSYVFSVRGTDVKGHVGEAATYAFTVDTVAPVVTMPAEGRYKDRSPAIEFSSEPDATFECSLDGAAYQVCASPHAPGTLKPGPHTLAVRATDLAGNVSAPALQAFRVFGPPER